MFLFHVTFLAVLLFLLLVYDITVGLSCKYISEHETCFFLFYMEQCGHMSLKPTEIWQGTY